MNFTRFKVDEAPYTPLKNPLFYCPISRRIMVEPVICADGHTYDRGSIEGWMHHFNLSPITAVKLDHKNLTPNSYIIQLMSETITDLMSKNMERMDEQRKQERRERKQERRERRMHRRRNRSPKPMPPLELPPPIVPINKYSDYMLKGIV